MTVLDASYYKRGDLVTTTLHNAHTSARVIGYIETLDRQREAHILDGWRTSRGEHGRSIGCRPQQSTTHHVKIAVNQPIDVFLPSYRFVNAGNPIYTTVPAEAIRLIVHDPLWNPFAVRPYASAEQFRKQGTYLNGDFYDPDDPVWVWEDQEWRPAEVTKVGRWISVRFKEAFRDRNGNRAKSYRTWQVWPVISESSARAIEGMNQRA